MFNQIDLNVYVSNYTKANIKIDIDYGLVVLSDFKISFGPWKNYHLMKLVVGEVFQGT